MFSSSVWSVTSTPLKTCFIVNLRSGRAARVLSAVRSFAHTQAAEVVLTERARHAFELASRAVADGCDRVVAVGGDGTMNEIAGALVGTRTTLGLVPCGSGDGLGRHLGIHGKLEHVFAILGRDHSRLIDTGVADGHPFFSVAGIGLEAEIAHRFNHLHRRGLLGYLRTGVVAFCKWQPQEYTISHGVGRKKIRALTLAVANAGQYGNNARIAPGARIDDGALDLVAIPALTLFNALPLVCRLFTGGLGNDHVTMLRDVRFVVERTASGFLQTDGEVHSAGTTVEFLVRPQSLRVLCPEIREIRAGARL